MRKLIILSVVIGSFMYAGTQAESEDINRTANVKDNNYFVDSIDDILKPEGRRRNKRGQRGKRLPGGGLR